MFGPQPYRSEVWNYRTQDATDAAARCALLKHIFPLEQTSEWRETRKEQQNQCCQPCGFPANLCLFFCGVAFFLKTCGLLVFGLVLTKFCLFFGLFLQICFSDCFFFKFCGYFLFQFAPEGILGAFLWKFGHFGLVFWICHRAFLFNLLADFSFCCIFLPTHVGLVFWSNCLFLACFSYFLACFCKITWHHWTERVNATRVNMCFSLIWKPAWDVVTRTSVINLLCFKTVRSFSVRRIKVVLRLFIVVFRFSL